MSVLPADGDKFPVLTTRLAEVEPIVRPKVGRRPQGVAQPQASVIKPVAFGTKLPQEKEDTASASAEKAPATARNKKRMFTPAFIALLVTVVLVMNLAFTQFMKKTSGTQEAAATSEAIILGVPSVPTLPAEEGETSKPVVAGGEAVEVIPYRRSYDPELIQKLEEQNPPAAGTPNQ